jgi:hypothetical protein
VSWFRHKNPWIYNREKILHSLSGASIFIFESANLQIQSIIEPEHPVLYATMDYTTLTESLEKLAKSDDPQSLMNDADRVRLMEAARAITLKFEMPFETYFRLIFSDMAVGLALVGVELGLWKAVAAKGSASVSASELAKQLGMLEDTMARILRFSASLYMVEEVGEDVYRANNITRHFTAERAESVLFLA